MSDFYYEYTGRARHAELVEHARANALIKTLPHHPSPLARLWARLTSPVRRPRARSRTLASGTARNA